MKQAGRVPGEVRVHLKGRNLGVTEAIRAQVEHKMSRLYKYLDRLQSIDVELWTEKTREAGLHHHVEASTHVAGKMMRVATTQPDLYAAVDEAVDRLYRQLNRRKERLKSHQ